MRFHPLLILLTTLCSTAPAQWLNYPAPGVPRNPDGKVNLNAPPPKAANGKPDLSGVWHVQPTRIEEFRRLLGKEAGTTNAAGQELDSTSKYANNIFIDLKASEIPERPLATEIRRARLANGIRDNPSLYCLPHGIPIDVLVSEAHKMVQTPGLIIVLYETDNTHRQIYTDGRKLPVDPQPAWLGYSVGQWERDTLVVESTGFNDKSWLDLSGHAHSEGLRITERFHRRDFGHLDVEMTFDDPTMYTRPFSIQITHLLQADSDVLESFCNENEKDRGHLVGK